MTVLTVRNIDTFERPYRMRMPFRFGVLTVTHGQQAIVRARIRLANGVEAEGYAAEALAAKWFDKDPRFTDDQNLHQLRRAVEMARDAYLSAGPSTAFGLFAGSYADHTARCEAEGLNPLVAGFGPALLDRAVMDALCRATGTSFYQAVQANLPGIDPAALATDLSGFAIAPFLSALRPSVWIAARHTVGLLDPITAADQSPGSRLDDGLPETLEEVVRTYGQRWFKLKVMGDIPADLDRLTRIASVLDHIPDAYQATLDGNEQFADAAQVAELWTALSNQPPLRRLVASIAFIEQPIKRQAVLTQDVTAIAVNRPLIIDESDDGMDAFPQARALGYAGVSSKTCKGFYKSILNAARCANWNSSGQPTAFLSGEDLTTQAGLSVQQDLALVNLLGLTHVERNAHHFIDGFDDRPESEAEAALASHPDLYHRQDGRVRLHVSEGLLHIGSLAAVGFASDPAPSVTDLEPMLASTWPGR